MQKINIPIDQLKRLYVEQNLSTIKIADLLRCNRQTVSNYLKIHKIIPRSPSQARIRYHVRKDFNGSLVEKAYLIGFRLGDLNVYTTSSVSETIVVRTHTTNLIQVNLLDELFKKYGKVTVSKSLYGYNINCFLNRTFNFLLTKNDAVEEWISDVQSSTMAFIAGYIDAEGCFQINQGRGRFCLAACDRNILCWIKNSLERQNINTKLTLITVKGSKSVDKYLMNNDVWRVSVNDRVSLFKLIGLLRPYLRHEKRISDMNAVLRNLESRIK